MVGQDLRSALRQLRRSPGFAFTVVLTLALAIGANTAIFSLVNALLLQRLPYPHPERMATMYARVSGPDASDERSGIDGEKWELLRDQVPSLTSAVAGGVSGVNLQAGAAVDYVREGRISAHYLEVLGMHPLLGQGIAETDDLPNGPRVALLSYDLWQNHLGGDAGVLGRSILLKGQPYTVVGVLPRGAFTLLHADLYTALQASRQGEGAGSNFDAIARLRPGANWAEANAELNRAWAARARQLEQRNPGAHVVYYLVPLQQAETDALRPQVLALMLAAGFILLIACANLAGLALARLGRRSRELATRLALGASVGQVQRLLWTENLVLALLGGAAGVGAGTLALHGLLRLLPADYLPVAGVALDGRVLGFTLAIALATCLLVGALPALAIGRVNLRDGLGQSTVMGAARPRLRQGLLAAEIALTVVLLAAAGLIVRTLIHLETLPPGFDAGGVVAAKASLDDVRYHDPAAFARLLRDSTAAMRRIPGVENAAVGLSVPDERAINDGVTVSDGPEFGRSGGTDIIYITPGYFDTLRMRLLAGREFTDADNAGAQKVAIVNQSFARKLLGGANPVGRHLNRDTVIVGEVGDVNVSSGLNPVAPLMTEQAMYMPAAQMAGEWLAVVHVWQQPSWIVRTSGPRPGLAGEMQRALAEVAPGLPFSGVYTMREIEDRTLAQQRVQVALLTAMGGLALLLSAVGLFALMSNLVSQRRREIGLRLALGSSLPRAMAHIGRFGAVAMLEGLGAGLAGCVFALRALRSALYGVGAFDATSLAIAVAVLVVVGLTAIVVPTARIAGIDPAKVLREP